ncbi:MAG: high frequency lysogenization protein [Cocleimonas sp.]
MESNTHNRAIAMAAIFQCVDGVSQIANTGQIDETVYNTAINSILTENADSAEGLFGSIDNLKLGLQSMMGQLSTSQTTPDGKPRDLEATRYALGLLQLEKKLNNNQEIFRRLIIGIEETQKKLEFFEIEHENITAALADIYANTISTIGPKIMVKGDQTHLANPKNAAKIRALLLAGVRAALLWRQAGGNRWKLLLERGKLQKQAESFLNQID